MNSKIILFLSWVFILVLQVFVFSRLDIFGFINPFVESMRLVVCLLVILDLIFCNLLLEEVIKYYILHFIKHE